MPLPDATPWRYSVPNERDSWRRPTQKLHTFYMWSSQCVLLLGQLLKLFQCVSCLFVFFNFTVTTHSGSVLSFSELQEQNIWFAWDIAVQTISEHNKSPSRCLRLFYVLCMAWEIFGACSLRFAGCCHENPRQSFWLSAESWPCVACSLIIALCAFLVIFLSSICRSCTHAGLQNKHQRYVFVYPHDNIPFVLLFFVIS